MSEVVLTSTITAAAAIICQLIISQKTSSLIAYRVNMLEKKVDKLSSFTEKIYALEGQTKQNAERITSIDREMPYLPHFVHINSQNSSVQ